MACWSDLNNDVLENIMGLISFPDQNRLSAVCQNWRHVAKNKRCSPAEQLPWLMMAEYAPTKKRSFYSLSENRHYYIDIPELQGQHWVGSSYGWLFMIDKEFAPRLFNPFTKESLEPPLLPAFEENMHPDNTLKAVLSHDPSKTHDFTVLYVYGKNITNVAFWRHGDNTWTCVPCNKLVSDAIYSGGYFYLALASDLAVIPVLGPNPTMKLVMRLPLRGIKYLVNFMGQLLLVKRHMKEVGDDKYTKLVMWHYVTSRFEVHHLDLEKKLSSCCNNFGDYTIFLGVSCPLVIDSQQFEGCSKRNSIYFTDYPFKFFPELHGCDDLGFYDFTKGTTEPYYPPEIFHPATEPPIWLMQTPTDCRFVGKFEHIRNDVSVESDSESLCEDNRFRWLALSEHEHEPS